MTYHMINMTLYLVIYDVLHYAMYLINDRVTIKAFDSSLRLRSFLKKPYILKQCLKYEPKYFSNLKPKYLFI